MNTTIRIWQWLTLLTFTIIFYNCQQTPPPPLPAPVPSTPVQAVPAVRQKYVDIFPFPAHFTVAKQDLTDFSGTVDVGYDQEIKRQKIGLHPVPTQRFGCYAMKAKTKWDGREEDFCANTGGVFDGSGNGFPYSGFVFNPLYDEGEYMSAVVSVWKVRGDSLDFYAILNKCFISEGWDTDLQIDSVKSISTKQKHIYGRISWKGEKRRRIVRPWSAIWTLPNRLEIH